MSPDDAPGPLTPLEVAQKTLKLLAVVESKPHNPTLGTLARAVVEQAATITRLQDNEKELTNRYVVLLGVVAKRNEELVVAEGDRSRLRTALQQFATRMDVLLNEYPWLPIVSEVRSAQALLAETGDTETP